MRRREFIAGLCGAAAMSAWPLPARAQSVPVIGFLSSATKAGYAFALANFRAGLLEAGFKEGQNVAIEARWADNRYDRLPALAAELIRLPVNVLIANGPAAPVAKAATSKIPIVFTAGLDPIELGLVSSLNRPGGNVTGIAVMNVELGPKRFELLREIVPTARTVCLLMNPSNPNASSMLHAARNAAAALSLQIEVINASSEQGINLAFETLAKRRVDALVVGTDPFFTTQSARLADLASRQLLPSVYQYREFAVAGGLMSYGGDLNAAYRRAGTYAGRILKGEKPSDLPVEQLSKVELIVNLKTAKALGLTVPVSLLGRADEVIE